MFYSVLETDHVEYRGLVAGRSFWLGDDVDRGQQDLLKVVAIRLLCRIDEDMEWC